MLKEESLYDENEGRMYNVTRFDSSETVADNIEAQKACPEKNRYKGNLVHVGSIHMGDIIRLKNQGYNLLSPDRDEVRRALCYIQTNEPFLLTVPGKPFARVRKTWA